jgi:hypothetical protein
MKSAAYLLAALLFRLRPIHRAIADLLQCRMIKPPLIRSILRVVVLAVAGVAFAGLDSASARVFEVQGAILGSVDRTAAINALGVGPIDPTTAIVAFDLTDAIAALGGTPTTFQIRDDGIPTEGPDPSGGPFTGVDVDTVAGENSTGKVIFAVSVAEAQFGSEIMAGPAGIPGQCCESMIVGLFGDTEAEGFPASVLGPPDGQFGACDPGSGSCIGDFSSFTSIGSGGILSVAFAEGIADSNVVGSNDLFLFDVGGGGDNATFVAAIPECGDGVPDPGEQCGEPQLPSCVAGQVCSVDCRCVSPMPPDLVVTAVTDPPTEACGGDGFSVTETTKNIGTASAAVSKTAYHLSLDSNCTPSDGAFGIRDVPGLDPGASSAGDATVTIPTSIQPGTYFLCACADFQEHNPESSETNNCKVSTGTVQVGRPDLVITAVSQLPSAVCEGDSFSVTDTTRNSGTCPTAPSETAYHLSLDSNCTPSDGAFGIRDVPGLDPGASSAGDATVTIPTSIQSGTYFLCACADFQEHNPESSETNNCTVSTGTVQVRKCPRLSAEAISCQKGIKKAGRTFVGKKLHSLDKCANGVFACVQTKEDGSAGQRDCVDKAGAKCAGELSKIGAEDAELRASIVKACNEDLVSNGELRSDTGLGYDRLADACQARDSVALIAACVAVQHECATERLFTVEEPRAGELVVRAGMDLGQFPCLANFNGGGSVGNPKHLGRALMRCEATIKKAGRKFVTKKLGSLEKCVDGVFRCLTSKPGDALCLGKAQNTCDKEFVKIETETGKLGLAVDKKCAAIDFGAVLSEPSGAQLAAPATECAMFGVPALDTYGAYKECLMRQHECRVEELLRFEAPRAPQMLASGGQVPQSSFCPTPPPPPIPTPTATPVG